MTRRFLSALCATLVAIPGVFAAFGTPSSASNNFSQKWFVGDTMHIAWDKGWSWGVDGQPQHADLFIAWFDDSIEKPFWKLLQTDIPTNVPGKFDWVVDIDDRTLATSTQYRLRLIQHATNPIYTLNAPRMPSRGFNVYPNPANSTTSSATSSVTSSTAMSHSTTPSLGSDTSSSNEKKKSSNAGAIAGGIVGGLAGLAILCGIILFALKRAKRKKKAENAEDPYVNEAKVENQVGYVPASNREPSELNNSARSELPGAGYKDDRPTIELEGSIPKR